MLKMIIGIEFQILSKGPGNLFFKEQMINDAKGVLHYFPHEPQQNYFVDCNVISLLQMQTLKIPCSY